MSDGREIDFRAATAAWLAVMIDRLNRGELPFAGVEDRSADHWGQCSEDQAAVAAMLDDFGTLQQATWDVPPASPLIDAQLRRLERLVRDQAWEETLWDNVLRGVWTAIPDDVAESLIDRRIAILTLGHLPLSDRMLFRLMDEVVEALLTLAKRRYINDRYTPDQFEEVLHAGRDNEWMLRSVVMLEPSHVEKARRLAECVASRRPPLRLPEAIAPSFRRAWESR